MFAYLGNTINIPATTTLVATPLPNSIALRPPYDNVSPSVSSSQLDNNARGNRNSSSKENAPQTVIVNSASENFSTITSSTNSPSYTANAQTSFLTQLAAGDISAEVRGLFAQYDKLVSFANVKYKPSNAGKPVDPIAIFKTLLQLEKESASHNLPDELPVELPSDLPYVKKASSVAPAESDRLQEIIPPQQQYTVQDTIPLTPENINQSNIKLYESATHLINYTTPTEVELA